ncbi:MAG: enoyl-CoA hydratase [Phyllobacteriaceae bacterium]|nr:enoyl-CoA hydratase [Phyllobacteriaceae bacterium]
MTEILRTERSGAVLRLILCDDASRNSLSENMIHALQSALDAAAVDPAVGAIIIAASGKVFSSGHNLKQLTAHRADADGGEAYYASVFQSCGKLMGTIARHRCAIIAEVDGLASAAGCQLVATCDLAYSSPRATYCTPGVSIGLFCSTPMVALSRNLSAKHSMEMLLTGDVVDADFAARVGLVNAVVGQNELAAHVAGRAAHIASKSRAAIAYGKRAFREQHAMPLDEAYDFTACVMTRNMLDESAREGLDAFVNKRHPKWPPLT